jgi:hypothetical protein
VVANDARDIHDDVHIACLIDRNRRIQHFSAKGEIACGIVDAVLGRLKEENTP